MLELLLESTPRDVSVYYPNSGPGNKYLLAGDENAGYFGEVTSSELLTGEGLVAATNLSLTSVDNNTTLVWLKFFFQGKIIYYAKQNVQNSMTWGTLYQAGLVYGTDGYGTYPYDTGVEQYTTVEVNDADGLHTLIIRLPRGHDTDPAEPTTPSVTSEWTMLLDRVLAIHPDPWDTFTPTDLGGNRSLLMESNDANTSRALVRGWGVDGTQYITSITKTTSDYAGWRPVLELVPGSDVTFSPSKVEYMHEGLVEPVPYAWTVSTEGVYTVNISEWEDLGVHFPSVTGVINPAE